MFEADADRVTVEVSSNGSGVAPCATPASAPGIESVKFSSVLHAVSAARINKEVKVLDNTG